MTEARLDILALHSMGESGGFRVEAMQTIGLFVDKSVILGNKLPSNLRRNDILMDRSRWRSGHYENDAVRW